MKKFFALFMVCAMAASLCAGSTSSTLVFNRGQFQLYYAEAYAAAALYEANSDGVNYIDSLTVPFAYTGTLSLNGYVAADNERLTFEELIKNFDYEDCIVDDIKCSIPVYMTICQPCIDCGLCTELLQSVPGVWNGAELAAFDDEADEFPGALDDIRTTLYESYVKASASNTYTTNLFGEQTRVGRITRWNIYLAQEYKDANKKKCVDLWKYSLLNDRTAIRGYKHDDYSGQADLSVFYTGSAKGNAYIQAYSGIGNMVMVGKKANYTFKYQPALLKNGKWYATTEDKTTAYIKSISSFKGIYSLAKIMSKYDVNGVTADFIVTDGNGTEGYGDSHLEGYQLNGTIKLSRNTSYTKELIEDAFKSTSAPTSGKDWSDCGKPVSANCCEDVLDETTADFFDTILTDKKYKSYETKQVHSGDKDDLVELIAGLVNLEFAER